jgi:hypothetical protein
MLADANISRASVSKAKPQRAAWQAIGAHTHRPTAAQGGDKQRRRRHGISVGLAGWYGPASTRIELRGGDSADTRGGGGQGADWGSESGRRYASWERVARGGGGDARWGGAPCQGDACR